MNLTAFNSRPLLALLLVGCLPLHARQSDPMVNINVNVSVTEAGKKRTPPTRAQPAYYYPVVAGYSELGEIVAGERVPPLKETVHLLAKALAQQGYLVTRSTAPTTPSVLLAFRWGYLNPDMQVTEETNETPADSEGSYRPIQRTVFFNKAHMLSLVGGQTPDEVEDASGRRTFEQERALQDAEEPRYFVTISAYDISELPAGGKKAFSEYRRKNLLWQARVSLPSAQATSLSQVLPAMIATAAPYFGRETMPPQRIHTTVLHHGIVDIGTATVAPESPKPDAR